MKKSLNTILSSIYKKKQKEYLTQDTKDKILSLKY